jgi:O-methyltransferase involved in polyketide biosynthesis
MLDKMVKDYVSKNSDATILNIACGMDTRFYRSDIGRIKWYNRHSEALLCKASRLRRTVLTHGSVIDDLAKMPLQASIFASWYNIDLPLQLM